MGEEKLKMQGDTDRLWSQVAPPLSPPPPPRVLIPPAHISLFVSACSFRFGTTKNKKQKKTWNWQSWFFWWGSIGLFFFFISVYSLFVDWAYDFYFVAFQMMSRPTFWLILIQVFIL